MNRYINGTDVTAFQKALSNADKILILSHVNPDGDAVGSVTALKNYLLSKGVNSTIILPNNYPDYLAFLDKKREIKIFRNERECVIELVDSADLIIAADFNALQRVDELECHILDSKAKKVLIDHHPDPQQGLFDVIISNTEASSTCELIYWLLKAIEKDVNNFGRGTSEPLYVGLMTDTNNFSNSVNPETFSMASDLLSVGVNKDKLQHKVFGGFSQSRMRLMGHLLLNKMVVLDYFGAAFILLSLQEQKEFNYSEGDSEGFVNLPLGIKGVNVSAFFTETKDHIRVSLRSVNDFSVNKFSNLHFNGGGHERASGGKLFMPLDDVKSYFIKVLTSSFEECGGVFPE